MQPLIRWTGSKRLVVKELLKLQPQDYNNYFEPFLGSGAMSYYQSKGNLSDICKPLIDVWNIFKVKPDVLFKAYKHHWDNLTKHGKDYFFQVRSEFNTTQNPLIFFFLLRTCVVGLVRFNRKGEFNSSYGYGRNGMRPENIQRVFTTWQPIVQRFSYTTQSFDSIEPKVKDFVFLDPPYQTSNQMYMGNLDYDLLYSFLENLNRKNVYWMLTTRTEIPTALYKTKTTTSGGNSTFKKLLQDDQKTVKEYIYLNYV